MNDEENQEVRGTNDPTAETLSHRRTTCTLNFEIYKDFQHIKSNVPAVLGSLGEFCAAFYHVPINNDQGCLDKANCKAAADGRWWVTPRSVVALVKYEMYNGSDIIVRYSNHYIKEATKHAEEFFKDDINQPQNEALRSSISNRNLRKITIYITSQPCHLSIEKTLDKSCCKVLLGLLDNPRLKDVEICIKPTHTYKAGSDGSKLVENGKDGIRKLMVRGIEITRMEKADWNFLLNLADMTDRKRRKILSDYSGSEREALDEKIGKFVRLQLALECPSTHNRLSVKHYLVKQDGGDEEDDDNEDDDDNDVQHLLDNLFQFCAFYHVFEQGEENESLCLGDPQCPYHVNGKWKPKVIVVNGIHKDDNKYEAKFTDCHRFGIKAEEFLCHSDLPSRVTAVRDNNIVVITIYTTWLSPDFCSMVLSLCIHLKSLFVSLCIKPSHIYKTRSEQLEGNGKKEIRDLMDGGIGRYIKITRMEEADWNYLLRLMHDDQATIPAYSGSGRERLDKEIDEFLRNIKIELANSQCSHTHCLIRGNGDGVSHLFDDLSQFCAFYHVSEQGEGNESLCLSESQCHISEEWKPNVIVVKGESEQDGITYEAKYIDCHPFDIKAQEFLHFNAETACNDLDQITIYTTWLSRGFHSMVHHLSSLVDVFIKIKLSHLHGGDDTSPDDFQNEVDALKSNGQITVQAMTEGDWEYLTENLPEVNRNDVTERYKDSRRQHLDQKIEEFLNPTATTTTRTTNDRNRRRPRTKRIQ